MKRRFTTAFFIASLFSVFFFRTTPVLPSLLENDLIEVAIDMDKEGDFSIFKHFLYIKDIPTDPENQSKYDAVLANYDQ